MDTDFDFRHNNRKRLHVELAREAARLIYDPRNRGTSYEMEYRGHGRFDEPGPNRGIGRIYHPFIDSQLKAALGNPGSAPTGLLPSFTAAPPPAIKEHLQYLDRANASQAQAPGASAAVPPFAPDQSKPTPQRRRRLDSLDGGRRSREPDAAAAKHGWGLGRQSNAAKAAAAMGLLRSAIGASAVSFRGQVFLETFGAAVVRAGSPARESRRPSILQAQAPPF